MSRLAVGIQYFITATADNQALPLTPPGTLPNLAEAVELLAIKASDWSNNAGPVKFGYSPVAANNLRPLQPGDSFPVVAPMNGRVDLAGMYVTFAHAGDSVLVTAQSRLI